MTWEGVAAVTAIIGLLANMITTVITGRSRRLSDVERRVHHCEKNIAVLDERTQRE